jgi:hypothetical protein
MRTRQQASADESRPAASRLVSRFALLHAISLTVLIRAINLCESDELIPESYYPIFMVEATTLVINDALLFF